jgi:hypothetical protein
VGNNCADLVFEVDLGQVRAETVTKQARALAILHVVALRDVDPVDRVEVERRGRVVALPRAPVLPPKVAKGRQGTAERTRGGDDRVPLVDTELEIQASDAGARLVAKVPVPHVGLMETEARVSLSVIVTG